jgi:hypothetical protein
MAKATDGIEEETMRVAVVESYSRDRTFGVQHQVQPSSIWLIAIQLCWNQRCTLGIFQSLSNPELLQALRSSDFLFGGLDTSSCGPTPQSAHVDRLAANDALTFSGASAGTMPCVLFVAATSCPYQDKFLVFGSFVRPKPGLSGKIVFLVFGSD